MAIPTVMYGSETWTVNLKGKRKVEVFDMMYLKNICGVRRSDRVRKSLIRERFGCEMSKMKRMERKFLKWFGLVMRKE